MWFNEKDLQQHSTITVNDLYGYVLPHAGTSHTGHIISHTLRFIPNKKIKKIIILYYPSSITPNITVTENNTETNTKNNTETNTKNNTETNTKNNTETIKTYYHEYYVPLKSLKHFFNDNTIEYEGINIHPRTFKTAQNMSVIF